jgi:hypothetical protein
LMEEKPFNLIELYIAFSADHPWTQLGIGMRWKWLANLGLSHPSAPVCLFVYLFIMVLETKARLGILGKWSTTELCPQPLILLLTISPLPPSWNKWITTPDPEINLFFINIVYSFFPSMFIKTSNESLVC